MWAYRQRGRHGYVGRRKDTGILVEGRVWVRDI
jgi:hypothetical protein